MSSDSGFPRPPIRRIESRTQSDPHGTVVASGKVASGKVASGQVASGQADAEASSSSERPLPLRRRKDEVGQVVAFPRPVSAKRRRAEPAPAEAPGPDAGDPQVSIEPPTVAEEVSAEPVPAERAPAQPTVEDQVPLDPGLRPAYLASELLREDWFPRCPLARTLRWGALGLGAAGAVGTVALGGTGFGPLMVASILACCALVGLVPLRPPPRGVALAVLGVLGIGFVGWVRMVDEPDVPLLAFGVTIASSALLFRAAHRTSRLARVLVAIGLTSVGAWLVLTGGLDALVVESFAWQHLVGPGVRVILGITVVAGVLTFLDPTGHGGAWIVGAALIGWLALDVSATMALGAWPLGGTSGGEAVWVPTLAYPFLAALGAGGLCQVWVLASRPGPQQPRRAH